jgi:hypothetical protein
MISTSGTAAFGSSNNTSSQSTGDRNASDSSCFSDSNSDKSLNSDELRTSNGQVKKSPVDQAEADKKQTNIFAGYGAAAGTILGVGQTFCHMLATQNKGLAEFGLGALLIPLYTALGAAIGAIAAKGSQKNKQVQNDLESQN